MLFAAVLSFEFAVAVLLLLFSLLIPCRIMWGFPPSSIQRSTEMPLQATKPGVAVC